MDKKNLRKIITAQKRAMTLAQIEKASADLTEQFLKEPLYKQASAIYAYLSYNQEVRTEMIIRQALKDGKRVAVPKVYGEDMRFIWIDGLDSIAPGAFNIPEPIEDEPVAHDKTALVLMPGLAFDSRGHRLGYGGGFYDRYLEEEPGHPLLALCYHFQMLDYVETQAHDIDMDKVLVASPV